MAVDIQALSDRSEIVELRARFARALDDQDWHLMRTVFIEDAYADFGAGQSSNGVENILDHCRSVMENLDRVQHFLGNHEVEIDGDRASGRYKLIGGAFLSTNIGSPTLCERGEYVDEHVRTDQGWRISRLEFTMSWCEGNIGISGAAISKEYEP